MGYIYVCVYVCLTFAGIAIIHPLSSLEISACLTFARIALIYHLPHLVGCVCVRI